MLSSISSVLASAMFAAGAGMEGPARRRSVAGGAKAVAAGSEVIADPVVFLGNDVVLAQRMAHPVLGAEDAHQVGVALVDDAEQVEGLALVPVRSEERR